MIIGRENELKMLHEAYSDEYSQFVVVYGRRRVGKTFLVREAFNYKFTFRNCKRTAKFTIGRMGKISSKTWVKRENDS